MTARTAPENIHGTAVTLGDRGLLITGNSGTGKTTLARALISQWLTAGKFARLVADDQIFVTARGTRVVARAPQTIAGLVEVRGVGIVPADHQPSAIIDFVIELRQAGLVERMPLPQTRAVAGINLPLLVVPANDIAAATAAITAYLDMK